MDTQEDLVNYHLLILSFCLNSFILLGPYSIILSLCPFISNRPARLTRSVSDFDARRSQILMSTLLSSLRTIVSLDLIPTKRLWRPSDIVLV